MAENNKEQNILTELENLKKEEVEIVEDKKEFYKNIIKKQKKIQSKENELQELRKDQILKQKFQRKSFKKKTGILGALGDVVGGRIKSTIQDLPFGSFIFDVADKVKENKKERAEFEKKEDERKKEFEKRKPEIAEERLDEFETGVDEKLKPGSEENEFTEEQNENIEEGNNKLDELIEVNNKGFNEIKDTLTNIDKEEDKEEIMEDRDYDRRLGDTQGKIEAVGKQAQKQMKDAKGKGILGALGGTLGKIADISQTARAVKDVGSAGISAAKKAGKGAKKAGRGIKKLWPALKKVASKMKGRKGMIIGAIAAAGALAYGGKKVLESDEEEKETKAKGKATGGMFSVNDNELLGEKGKPEIIIGGEKGTELKLDNSSTNKFFQTAKMLEDVNKKESVNKSNNENSNIMDLISKEVNKINQKFSMNSNLLNNISKKSLGNYNVANIIPGEQKTPEAPQVKYFYNV